MTSKLRIKIGEVEIDYEGSEDFLKQELPQLLKTAMELHSAVETNPDSVGKGKKKAASNSTGVDVPSLTTGSIAAKIGAKSGSDLLFSAAGHLALVKKMERFSRQQLLDEMKTATSYYKKNFATNLSSYLKTALNGPLSEVSKDTFALTAKARADMENKLANN